MIHPQEQRLQKILDAIERLGISEAEKEIIEAYLQDEKGEDALEALTVRDFLQLPQESLAECRSLITMYIEKERVKELQKMLQIVFALGHSGCSSVIDRVFWFCNKDFRQKCNMEEAKCVAILVNVLGRQSWSRRADSLNALYEMADYSLVNLLKAEKYCHSDNMKAKCLLYTMYLEKKYEEILKKPVENVLVEEQDKDKLEYLETVIVQAAGYIFKVGTDCAFMTDEWRERLNIEVAEGKISEETKAQVKGLRFNEKLLNLLGGCAFICYRLSSVLSAFVRLCAAARPEEVLNTMLEMDCCGLFKEFGGEFDEIFGIDSLVLLQWAVEKKINSQGRNKQLEDAGNNILSIQLHKNQERFLEYQSRVGYEQSKIMLEVVAKEEKELYKSLIESGAEKQKALAIDILVQSLEVKKAAIDYLQGKKTIEDMYLVEETLCKGNVYGGEEEWNVTKSYLEMYGDVTFYNQTLALMSLCRRGYFFYYLLHTKGIFIREKEIMGIFKSLKEAGMNVLHQIQTVAVTVNAMYNETDKAELLKASGPIFMQYLEECPQEAKNAFATAEAYGRYFGLCVMEQDSEKYKTDILGFSQDSAKIVKEKLLEILKAKEEWRVEIMTLLSSKKAIERELAINVLIHWNKPQDVEALQKLVETEKNAKIRALLENVPRNHNALDNMEDVPMQSDLEELVKNIHKGGKKRSLSWAYETPFSEVHRKSGKVAEEEYLQAILLCYAAMATLGLNKDAKMLAGDLEEAELAIYVNELFDKWLEAGAEAKKRWVMYASAIHGGSVILQKLHHQIQEWPLHARGTIAAEAVRALALNPQSQALLLVDGLARKFKFRQVKEAAGKALEYAAEQLGITRDELEDKIVPNLGFDEKMERQFDYGERSFTVTITPDFEIQIFGEEGNRLKKLPLPGKKDDEKKANAAYAEFKEMKRQMRAIVSAQKKRLEQALASGRVWSVNVWQDLFVRNPIMHRFAIGLIWGIYEEHKLVQSFRYMEDGSFNTEKETEYMLPEQGQIGLVHPIELTTESKDAWKQQLEDYEINQPIAQLNRETFYRTAEEEQANTLERFGGWNVNDLVLNGQMLQLGWERGVIGDGGCFDTFYREDSNVGLGIALHFSGTYVACENKEVTIYEAGFYKAGEVAKERYLYTKERIDKMVPLKAIPERYFSEIVLQLSKATASGIERDADWKNFR